MSTRCKPGDLAYIVGSDYPENLGRILLVVKDGTQFFDIGRVWECECISPIYGERVDGYGVGHGETLTAPGELVCADDADLRPITPPPGTVTDSEVLELYSPKQREAV